MNLLTENKEIILASESQTRRTILKQYGIKFKIEKHKINEKEYLNNNYPKKTVSILAKEKAKSIKEKFPNSIIIGSDQILICKGKIFLKATTKTEAFENFLKLRNQSYTLMSSIYILKKGKLFWKTTKKAKLFMKNIRKKELKNYINKNKKTVLSILGGYKIEEDKMNCIKILKGDIETIQGFPIENFIKKINLLK